MTRRLATRYSPISASSTLEMATRINKTVCQINIAMKKALIFIAPVFVTLLFVTPEIPFFEEGTLPRGGVNPLMADVIRTGY